MIRRRNYGVLMNGLLVSVVVCMLAACSPEIHEMHKKPDEWKYLDVGKQKVGDRGTPKPHKPFGCDSRDLATFTCD